MLQLVQVRYLKDIKSKNETLLELQQAAVSSQSGISIKKGLRKEEEPEKLSCECREQVMWARKMECVLFYGFLAVYFNNACNMTICKQCFYPLVI